MTHGVIGNTTVFGSVIQGSSPCGSTKKLFFGRAFFVSRLGLIQSGLRVILL